MPKRVHKRGVPTPPPRNLENKISKLSGKKIEEKKAFFDTTMGKVVAVAGIALIALSFVTAGIYLYTEPNEEANEQRSQKDSELNLQPYLSEQDTLTRQVHLTKFEPYTGHFVHNGFYSMANGNTDVSCRVLSSLDELNTCKEYAIRYFGHYQDISESEKQRAYDLDGFTVSYDEVVVRLGVNPWLRSNYQNALKTVELTLLSPVLEDLDIEQLILDIHTELTDQLKNSEDGTQVNKGAYRTRPVAIQPDGFGNNLAQLMTLAEKKNGEGSFLILLRAAQKFRKFDDISRLTPEEKRVFTSVYDVCSSVKDVPHQMEKFSKDYAKKIRQPKTMSEVFDLAAWVHMSLVKIHPFEDGNGRLARILMNTELKRFGYHSVVFLRDKEYSKAIQKDLQQPGAFAAYIAQVYDTIPEAMQKV